VALPFWGISIKKFRLFFAAGTVAIKWFLLSSSALFTVRVEIALRGSLPVKTRGGETCKGKASTFSFPFRQ
jgi:hypothetical protein